jgi:hypothetical protein
MSGTISEDVNIISARDNLSVFLFKHSIVFNNLNTE